MIPFIAFSSHVIAALLHLQLVNQFYDQRKQSSFTYLFNLLMLLSGILHLIYAGYYGLKAWALPTKYIVMAGYSLLAFIPGVLAAMFLSELRLAKNSDNRLLIFLERQFIHPYRLLRFTLGLSVILLFPDYYQELTGGHTYYSFGNIYALLYLVSFLLTWLFLYWRGMRPNVTKQEQGKPVGYLLIITICILFSILSTLMDFGHSWSFIPIFSTVGLSLIFCWRRFRAQFLDTLLNQLLGISYAIFALALQYSLNQYTSTKTVNTEQALLLNLFYLTFVLLIFLILKRSLRSFWLPSKTQLLQIHQSLPTLLSSKTSYQSAISTTEKFLSDIFATNIKINNRGPSAANHIVLNGLPKLEVHVAYKHGWLPWFSESIEWITTALLYLQNHLVTVENLKQQHEHQIKTQQLSELAAKAEIKALHAQIQPHFLFNVLNTIHEQVSCTPALAEKTIESLADMIRTSLYMSEQEQVTLEQELNLVKNYLAIQKLRYEQQFDYQIKINNELYSVLIPPFIIQPIVENTIKHAVDQQLDPVKMRLNIYKQNQLLIIEVTDDGPGLNKPSTAGLWLATQNIKNRLSLRYNEKAQFAMTCNLPKGVKTQLILPVPPELQEKYVKD